MTSELTVFVGAVGVESSATSVVKSESVASCTRYVAAPADAVQFNATVKGWLVAPLAGLPRTGTAGAAMIVVNAANEVYALVPPTFFALTLQ